MKSKEQLLELAKREVTRRELAGEDYQAVVTDILNDQAYAPLFAGLTEDEEFDLCSEISNGEE